MQPDNLPILFPFADYWGFYAGFIAFVLVVLALDLGVFHKNAHEVSFKEATLWSIVWVSLALLFNFGFYHYSYWKFTTDPTYLAMPGFDAAAAAKQMGLEFLTGFVVEKSLAVDNIFIFAVVFNYFCIPRIYHHRVLFYGIIGAILFRGMFIALGSVLLSYHTLVIVFGLLLIFTGIKTAWSVENSIEPEKNFLVRWVKRVLPFTHELNSDHFFVKQGGRWLGTPLLLALIFIEVTDIIFAVDSVPAVFAVTNEPLIVFTSNIFAILGLRAMFFMLGGVLDRFVYIKYGLAGVLVFVGLKMVYLNKLFDGKFPITWSLAIIATLIGGSIVVSLLVTKKETGEKNENS